MDASPDQSFRYHSPGAESEGRLLGTPCDGGAVRPAASLGEVQGGALCLGDLGGGGLFAAFPLPLRRRQPVFLPEPGLHRVFGVPSGAGRLNLGCHEARPGDAPGITGCRSDMVNKKYSDFICVGF
eukprot:CAMPEP_0113934322 /NCGR_PEP_ID=MMETSP1339-20121228/1657_1 /TAXON_ID=94617 /ORGANISM="Fibrocapsa japonica" /LENGTH=125 /DNA_ID=CAMNT_0000936071 /DNA_START=202 /DNA_END=579 /DNA_ORIENTATION=- /assembly_acc=CAM_ASM_000762